jgi:hypothetical protein
MLKSVVIEAMYRLRCWKVAERFNSPYCTRGEIGGMRRGAMPSDRSGLGLERRLWNLGRLWAFVF